MELFLAIYAARSSDPRTKINSSVIISYEWINLLFYFTISWTCFYEFKLFLLDRRTRLFLFLFLFLNSYRTFKDSFRMLTARYRYAAWRDSIERSIDIYSTYRTLLDRRPAVGVRSLGSDSGIGSSMFSICMPGHPTQTPFPLITTGATAVTRPPALEEYKVKITKKTKAYQGEKLCNRQRFKRLLFINR